MEIFPQSILECGVIKNFVQSYMEAFPLPQRSVGSIEASTPSTTGVWGIFRTVMDVAHNKEACVTPPFKKTNKM